MAGAIPAPVENESFSLMTWSQILHLLPVVPALSLAASDFRHRSIPIGWLIAFGSCVLSTSMLLLPVRTVLYNVLTNILLLCWLFGGVWVYLRLRYRRQANLFRQYIGSGDVWFALLLTPLFALPAYIVLLLSGFASGLFYWTAVRIVFRKETTIPLVTFLSLPLTAYLSYRFYLSLP